MHSHLGVELFGTGAVNPGDDCRVSLGSFKRSGSSEWEQEGRVLVFLRVDLRYAGFVVLVSSPPRVSAGDPAR